MNSLRRRDPLEGIEDDIEMLEKRVKRIEDLIWYILTASLLGLGGVLIKYGPLILKDILK